MEFRYRYGDAEYSIQLERLPDGKYRARVADRSYQFEIQRSVEGQLNLCVDGRRVHAYTALLVTPQLGITHQLVALVDREVQLFDLEKAAEVKQRRISAAAEGSLLAQMPGQIIEVRVADGDQVEAGQVLVILEAMKMEIRVSAPMPGTVKRILVVPGQTVERGQPLVELTDPA